MGVLAVERLLFVKVLVFEARVGSARGESLGCLDAVRGFAGIGGVRGMMGGMYVDRLGVLAGAGPEREWLRWWLASVFVCHRSSALRMWGDAGRAAIGVVVASMAMNTRMKWWFGICIVSKGRL